jgi:hypothetical protein
VPAAVTHHPILIVGANGTGTTLLRLMLDSHEHIAIPPETGFLRLAAMHRWVPYWELGGQWSRALELSDADIEARLAAFYGELFASYAEQRGKSRWGEKTPFHVWHLELAARMYPDLQVIGIVRHPGAVAASLRRRFRRPLPRAIKHWKRSTKQLLVSAAALGERCVIVRYEDLVGAPEPTLRALLDWLGEPWSDRVLAHHETPRAAGEAEGFTRADAPVDASRLDAWEQQLGAAGVAKVARRTRALADFLGYDASRAAGASQFGDGPLVTGAAVRRMQAGSPINWSATPRRPVADKPLRPPAPPRKRKRRRQATLDDFTISEVVRHRAISMAQRHVPDSTRHRLNRARRSRPWLDRLIGPR